MNNGAGQFADVSAIAGFDLPDDGRALAQVDWDDDGDLDCWISNRNGPQLRFLENRTNELSTDRHFLKVHLVGVDSNRDAVGARVTLFLRGDLDRPLTRTVRAGDSFLSQSSKRLHFGLGVRSEIDRLEVTWPAGATQVVREPKSDTTISITEGSQGLTYQPQSARRIAQSAADVVDHGAADDSEKSKTVCFSMIALPARTYRDMAGTDRLFLQPSFALNSVQPDLAANAPGKRGPRLVLVNLWASWCSPCVEEIKEFTAREDELRKRGVDVVALSVGGLGEQVSGEAESQLLSEIGFPFRRGVADESLIAKLQMLNDTLLEVREPLPIPTSFLIDKKRRVLIVYKGPVSVDELLDDLQRIQVKTTNEWRAATVPFAGTWITSPKRRHLFHFVEQLTDRGFLDEARDYVQRNPDMFVNDKRWPKLQRRLVKP